MSVECPACGALSDCEYRCESCGKDLVSEGTAEAAQDEVEIDE